MDDAIAAQREADGAAVRVVGALTRLRAVQELSRVHERPSAEETSQTNAEPHETPVDLVVRDSEPSTWTSCFAAIGLPNYSRC